MIGRKILNEEGAIVLIHNILTSRGLHKHLKCQVGNMLRENRRDPLSDSAIKSGQLRGNRAEYGIIPRQRSKGVAHYSEVDLTNWVYSVLIPKLEVMAIAELPEAA